MPARVLGFKAGGLACGIKPSGTSDLALIASDRPAVCAALFTRSRFPGAPVVVSRAHARGPVRAVIVNSGISNVAMGARGLRDARRMTELTARALGLRAGEVLVASTGVIGQPLPMPRIARAIPELVRRRRASGWPAAARAILTTDLRPKLVHARVGRGSIVGIAKGSGMIMPDVATMLVFLATDLPVEPRFLRASLREATALSFNQLSIDGEMSTSDVVAVLANGAAGGAEISEGARGARAFSRTLREVCEQLTEKLALDGEGVTRLAEIRVAGTRSHAQADRAARKIANSLLVKTALFGGDPNWGRVVQSLGAAGVPFRVADVEISIGGVRLLRRGEPCAAPAERRRAGRAMRAKKVRIEIGMGRGPGRARVLTCDLSYDYVRINAEYTT